MKTSRRKAYKRFGGAETLCLTGFIPGKQDEITGPRMARARHAGNKQQVIYKHAISTIAPVRAVSFHEEEAGCLPEGE